jgi:hypothetical protein
MKASHTTFHTKEFWGTSYNQEVMDITTFPQTTPYPEYNSTLLAYDTVSVGDRYLTFQRNWYDSSIAWSVQWLDYGLGYTEFDSRLG